MKNICSTTAEMCSFSVQILQTIQTILEQLNSFYISQSDERDTKQTKNV